MGTNVLHMEHLTPALAVAREVTSLIESSGLSRREVSSRTGIPLTTLTRRLTGISPFSITELDALASVLDTTVLRLVNAADQANVA